MSNRPTSAFDLKTTPPTPGGMRAIMVTLTLIGMLLLAWTAVQVA